MVVGALLVRSDGFIIRTAFDKISTGQGWISAVAYIFAKPFYKNFDVVKNSTLYVTHELNSKDKAIATSYGIHEDRIIVVHRAKQEHKSAFKKDTKDKTQ